MVQSLSTPLLLFFLFAAMALLAVPHVHRGARRSRGAMAGRYERAGEERAAWLEPPTKACRKSSKVSCGTLFSKGLHPNYCRGGEELRRMRRRMGGLREG